MYVVLRKETISTNLFMYFLHHVSDVLVMSGRKQFISSCTIGLVKTLIGMFEDWPPNTRCCGVKRILLVERFLHYPELMVFAFRRKLFCSPPFHVAHLEHNMTLQHIVEGHVE